MKDERDYIVTSVQRALEILKLFEFENTKLSLVEISDMLMLNKSTVFRLVTTLCSEGFLQKDSNTNKYSLGITVCNMGSSFFASMNIREIALPILQELADETDLVVHFAIMSEDFRVIIIAKVTPRNTKYVHNLTSLQGGELPIHGTGIGKIYLANMPPAKARKVLEGRPLVKYTNHTVVDIEEILEALPKIAEQGYATSINEHEQYASSVAGPVYDYTGNLCAGISVGGISEMCNDIGIDVLSQHLLKSAREISKQLGYRFK